MKENDLDSHVGGMWKCGCGSFNAAWLKQCKKCTPTEDIHNIEADDYVSFLKSHLDMEYLKSEYKLKCGNTIRSEMDFAVDYYNVIDSIANKKI